MKSWTPQEIKALRERYSLSQAALGRLLGVTGNYVYLMEKGVRRPSKTLKLLLDCVKERLEKKKRKEE